MVEIEAKRNLESEKVTLILKVTNRIVLIAFLLERETLIIFPKGAGLRW